MLGYTKCEGLALQIHTPQADDVYPNLFIFPKEGLSSGLCLGSGIQCKKIQSRAEWLCSPCVVLGYQVSVNPHVAQYVGAAPTLLSHVSRHQCRAASSSCCSTHQRWAHPILACFDTSALRAPGTRVARHVAVGLVVSARASKCRHGASSPPSYWLCRREVLRVAIGLVMSPWGSILLRWADHIAVAFVMPLWGSSCRSGLAASSWCSLSRLGCSSFRGWVGHVSMGLPALRAAVIPGRGYLTAAT